MRKLILILTTVFALTATAQENLYGFTVKDEYEKEVKLEKYRGKVLLIVNTATRCGFTPQYKELQELYDQYKEQGFEILDFPCNQFGAQAPGSIQNIRQFCTENYETTFPLFDKIEVNGANELPLYTWLKSKQGFRSLGKGIKAKFMSGMLKKKDPGYASKSDIKWNFTKFLVDRQGKAIARFEPTQSMKEVAKAVAKAVAE
ncbi:glutathione peroxidase [Prevotella sp. KH2C16]|uniref:glutathione peroxidase n=1 Tax=Prevotella sp. KH2C16 TaxID=1855325 RepID=UPI000B8872C9|nr:glutathione peroxidase [Prevotella sp. KH2C16]